MNKGLRNKLNRLEKQRLLNTPGSDISEIATNIEIYFEFLKAQDKISEGVADSNSYPIYVKYTDKRKHLVEFPTGEKKYMTDKEIAATGRTICQFKNNQIKEDELTVTDKERLSRTKSIIEKYLH